MTSEMDKEREYDLCNKISFQKYVGYSVYMNQVDDLKYELWVLYVF